ncbi:hypothetical protein [Streptomyces gardneri]|uniref:hypothetical protein n=1 Tax=Streptomyces gardneri TaxID=66892 RepID=UPI003677F8B7
MSKEYEDLAKDIADLKKALVEPNPAQEKVVREYQGDHEAPDDKKQDREPRKVEAVVSDLKRALIAVEPRVVTDDMLPFDFPKRFESMYEELQKEPMTEYLEGLGLGGLAAAFEKFKEAQTDDKIQWQNWLYAALGGMALAVLVPVLALIVAGQFTNFQRWVQQLGSGGQRRILAFNENGQIRPQVRRDVEARERRVANGGTSLADLVGNPTNVEQTRKLREELEKLNPEVLKFNNRAPAFISDFGRLPSEAKANKAVKAVDAIAAAMGRINQAALATFAGNIGKIADRLSKADPLHIGKVAEAIGKLVAVAKDLKPEMIPQARRVQDSATAVGNLARESGNLRTKFEELRGTVHSLDQQFGGA